MRAIVILSLSLASAVALAKMDSRPKAKETVLVNSAEPDCAMSKSDLLLKGNTVAAVQEGHKPVAPTSTINIDKGL